MIQSKNRLSIGRAGFQGLSFSAVGALAAVVSGAATAADCPWGSATMGAGVATATGSGTLHTVTTSDGGAGLLLTGGLCSAPNKRLKNLLRVFATASLSVQTAVAPWNVLNAPRLSVCIFALGMSIPLCAWMELRSVFNLNCHSPAASWAFSAAISAMISVGKSSLAHSLYSPRA